MAATTTPTKIALRAVADCPVAGVTVYADRAEVVRTVRFELGGAGLYDVEVKGLSVHVDERSVHVSGGAGAAVILEVATRDAYDEDAGAGSGEERASAAAQKRAKLEELESDLRALENRVGATRRTAAWVDGLAESVQQSPAKMAGRDQTLLSPEWLEKVRQFAAFYATQLRDTGAELIALERQQKDLQERVAALKREINDLSGSSRQHRHRSKTATISLSATAAGPAALELAYVVNGCKWSAAYDCRVDSQGTMGLTYYGVITNGSNEDWVDASVALSTATPSIGGEPPKLGTATVSFYSPVLAPPMRGRGRRASVEFDEMMVCQTMSVESTSSRAMAAAGAPAPPMAVLTTKSSEAIASSTFRIPRKATVLSDNHEHKVTIAVVPNIAARLTYTVVPRLSEFAFLKASATNNSEYPFLPGPCSVFIDSNFVATTSLNHTSVGEDLVFFLGTDPAVKVEYRIPSAVHDEQGLIRKSSVDRFVGSITVKNTKGKDISVVVYEQIPRSDTEQIKVTVQEPDLSRQSRELQLNPKNNIEWRANIAAGQSATFTVRFQVEFPKDKSVSFTWG